MPESGVCLDIPREWMPMIPRLPNTHLEEITSEMKVICMEQRTGLVDRALCRIIVEVYEKALLHVDGSNAHDGREKEEQIGDQLHIDDVGDSESGKGAAISFSDVADDG